MIKFNFPSKSKLLNIEKNNIIIYLWSNIVVMGDETEGCLSRPTTLPERLRQRAASTCCTSRQMSESSCDTALVDTEEFVNNYVSLSELKDYNLINR